MKDYHPFDDFEPDFINEEGVKYWTIDSANKRFVKAKTKYRAFHAELKDGEKQKIILEDNKFIYETQKLEDFWIKVDVLIYLANEPTRT